MSAISDFVNVTFRGLTRRFAPRRFAPRRFRGRFVTRFLMKFTLFVLFPVWLIFFGFSLVYRGVSVQHTIAEFADMRVRELPIEVTVDGKKIDGANSNISQQEILQALRDANRDVNKKEIIESLHKLNLNVSQNLSQAEILQILRNPNLKDNQKKILQSLYDFPFGANIFETPLEEIRQRVAKISWVKNASVRLRLPDTVVIMVEERTPYAIWKADGQWRLIDKEGFFITDKDLAKYNLPLVAGKGADKKVREYVEISRDFPEIRPLVRFAERVSDRRWTLHMENEARIELSESNPRASLDRLQKLQQKYDILNRAYNINLTSPHQTFFTGKNGAPAQKWVHEGET